MLLRSQTLAPVTVSPDISGEPAVAQDSVVDQPRICGGLEYRLDLFLHLSIHAGQLLLE